MHSMLSLKVFLWSLILLVCYYAISCKANQQGEYLHNFIQSKRSQKPSSRGEALSAAVVDGYGSKLHVVEQQSGLSMEADKVKALPGQPQGVDFDQYAGYVTVDAKAGRTLFYYFVESPQNSSTKPLVLWLNGGPGCSSLGYGAMQELGPFRVNSDGTTLSFNPYAWNIMANIIFLESPAGVGFSYSKNSLDYSQTGDNSTALDSYTFLLNWLERFPQYKTRDFFIAGESYAGHYVPQLADLILSNNKQMKNHTVINLKGIAIGNGWIDDNLCTKGMYDYFWMHALNSDKTHEGIEKLCDFENGNFTSECNEYQILADDEVGNIDIYNIYAPLCHSDATKTGANPPTYSGSDFDPCSEGYTTAYLNLPEVQEALHAKVQKWSPCSELITWTDSPATILPTINRLISGGISIWIFSELITWTDSPATILPTINRLISGGISIWIFSGDIDGRVPITSTRYAVNALKLPVHTAWRPWYTGNEVGGYVVGYKGLTLITVRGAGHMVPSHQPHRASTMFSYFLSGQLPPQLAS